MESSGPERSPPRSGVQRRRPQCAAGRAVRLTSAEHAFGGEFHVDGVTGPDESSARHINADIADATVRYINATGDQRFEREAGLEILAETARMWHGLGHYDRDGQFHLHGVTGPDEYSALASDNVYTNLMAQRNLLAAADAADRHPLAARELGVDDCEAKAWREAAAARPYFDLYRQQVIKQADLVLAMHWRGDAFTPEQRPATSPTTSSGPSATRPCRPAPRPCSPRRSGTPNWPTTTSARRR